MPTWGIACFYYGDINAVNDFLTSSLFHNYLIINMRYLMA